MVRLTREFGPSEEQFDSVQRYLIDEKNLGNAIYIDGKEEFECEGQERYYGEYWYHVRNTTVRINKDPNYKFSVAVFSTIEDDAKLVMGDLEKATLEDNKEKKED